MVKSPPYWEQLDIWKLWVKRVKLIENSLIPFIIHLVDHYYSFWHFLLSPHSYIFCSRENILNIDLYQSLPPQWIIFPQANALSL